MGRRRTGAKPYSVIESRGVAYLSCTIAGVRRRESLGKAWPKDRRGQGVVEQAAAERYAQLVAGRVLAVEPRIKTAATIDELLNAWLDSAAKLYPATIGLITIHSRRFDAFFDSTRAIFDDAAPARYALQRLQMVLRETVKKELTSLFGFYGWCKLQGYVASVPPRPELPAGAKGKRVGRQRAAPLTLSPAEALAIIDALPEYAARGGRGLSKPEDRPGAFAVRDWYQLLWETGLRPGTINRLEVPRHWQPGRAELAITEDIDKARYARTVPLTAAAVAILERHAPPMGGVIFGDHAQGAIGKRVAKTILGAERGRIFAPYDLRHARATYLLALSADIKAVGRLVGHKRATTTNRYLHTDEERAARALRLAELGSDSAAPQNDKGR